MKKRILSVLCTLCLIVGLLPTTAFAWTAPSNITIKDATYHNNGTLSSITGSFYWSTGSATSRLVLMTKKLNTTTALKPTYGDFTDQGTYGSSFSSFDAVENYDKTNSTFGIISSSSEASVQMSQTNTLKIEFAKDEIPLTTDALYYVYLWTYYGGHYYPDNLICAIQVKDGTVQYAGATGRNSYDAFDYVVSQEKFDVTITSGANITKTDESGTLTQADLTAPMTPVVFTANDGYYFPEDYAVDTVSGIRVVRNSETKITVEGAPTADAFITLTAPTAKTFTVTYIANGGTGAVPTDNTAYLSNAEVTVKAGTDLTKEDFAFNGWNTAADGTGAKYVADDKFNINANTTLYAQWKSTVLEDVTFGYAYDVQRSPAYPAKDNTITASSLTKPLDADGTTSCATNEGNWTLTRAGTYAYVKSLGNDSTMLQGVVNNIVSNYSNITADKVVLHELKDGSKHIAYGVVVAYDAEKGIAIYLGGNRSGGAGYLLSVDAQSGSVSAKAGMVATDFVPEQTININQSGTYNFESQTVGYAAQTPVAFTVTNAGNTATGALNVTLSGTNAGSFTLGDVDATLKAGIALSGSDTFTVVPNVGLTAGAYTATITVSGQNIASKSFDISFTVTAPTTYGVTVQNDGNGTASATPSSATTGTVITLTADPSTGYKFKEWEVISGGVTISENKFSMPASDVTVKAIFEKETYTISWDTDGDGDVDATTNVAYGDTPTHADGSKTEDTQYTYTFAGWDPAITAATGTATYTAQFTPVARSYGVTLNANSGTIASGKNITAYTYGVGATLPTASDMTKTGYAFDGWFDNASFTDTAVTAIGTTETGNKEYWAKWTANQYTVTLNAQGGTDAPDSITVTYDGTYSNLVNPTRPSYTFAGWFTAAEGGMEVTNSTTVSITAPQTLYAHWTLESDAELEDVTFTHAYDVQRSPSFPAKNDTITLRDFKYPLDANGDRGATNEGAWTLTEVGAYYTVKNTASAYLESVVNGIADKYTGIAADEIVIHELKNSITHVAYGVVVAYDAASGRAVFLGDTWSGGAGYLLAAGTQTAPANMTATAVPTDFVYAADYRITLDRTGTYTFAAATAGYAAQSPATITVTNAGSAAISELTVALSGANADSFTLSKSSIIDIAVSGSDTFTVIPNTGLVAGTYTATVTVSGTNVVPKSFDVTFTVNAITVTFDANGGTVTPTSNTTGADGKLTSLPTPTRSGSYSFKGWYTAANGGTQITTDTVFTENTTIFAQWTYTGGSYYPATYTVVVEDAANGDVSASTTVASKGTTVTIQIAPDKGYTLETLTATDRSGKEIELTKVSDGKYTFKMPASKVTVQATFMEDNTMLNFFVDVPADAYYYDAVLWAAENGITEGTSATTFSPDMACTRAQMVTFLWRAVGSPEPTSNVCPFTDVDLDSYYGKAVLWAVENGITKGTSTTTFSPGMACSRAHMVTFICRMADGKPVSGIVSFTDVPADAYYAEPVQWAAENGITNGTGDNEFSPDATCTRAQMVTFLYRYFEN